MKAPKAFVHVYSCLLAITLFVISGGAWATAPLGRTTVGSIPSAGLGANFKRGSRFDVSERGAIEVLCAYLDGEGGVSGSQTVRYAVYKDANGVPGQKILESETLTITSGSPGAWECAISDVAPVVPGRYWFVIHSGTQGGVVRDYADGTGNWYGNADTFSDRASDPFGSGSTGNGTLSIYAYFTPATETDYAGRLDVAKIPSKGLSANFKRGSQITFAKTGRLNEIRFYLDTAGGAAGTQDARVALYNDANGKPGTKLIESDVATPTPGFPAHWGNWIMPPVLVNAGHYWLVLHTGSNAGVLRDYGDGAANFYSNVDEFADGASDPFGTATAGTVTLSAYASYNPGPFYTKTFGRTDVAATPSGGMTANYKRASYAFMRDDSAVLTGLYAYLDGRGGASGSQQLRMALYRMAGNNTADAKLVESDVVTIIAGTAPGWVHFPVPPIRLQEYYGYYIALQSGPTGGVVRNYGDGPANWIGNADTFADGASATFGPASSGTVTLSMYGTFSSQHP